MWVATLVSRAAVNARSANTNPFAPSGEPRMRRAITLIELTIGCALLIGLAAYMFGGFAEIVGALFEQAQPRL
jgi:hypothetical protein